MRMADANGAAAPYPDRQGDVRFGGTARGASAPPAVSTVAIRYTGLLWDSW